MIVRRFLAAGKSPRLPSALVERGCTPLQRTIEAPLGRIASAARAQGVAPPAILVVGQIVALRRRMARQGRLPLKGITVLVTRPAGQAERMARLIEERGALPVLCPFIGIRPPRNLAPLDRAIAARSHYDWIIFTSANGVRAFMERLDSLGLDARALAGVKVCAVGPATAAELRDRGVRADCTPREFTTAGIVRALAARGVIEGGTFLLPRSDVAGVALPLALEKLGGRCRAVTAYRTIGLSKNARAAVGFIREMNVDVVSLTSPSAADVYAEALGGGSRERSPGPVIAAIGPVTAAAARARGLRVAIESGTHTDKGLVRAIEAYVLHTRRRNRSSE
jgi:uroporphyrinogen III methyltransferase/synthase